MNNDHQPLDVDAITARAEAAPGGLWQHADGKVSIAPDPAMPEEAWYLSADDCSWAGARDMPAELAGFLTTARSDVLALAAEVRRLRTELARGEGETR